MPRKLTRGENRQNGMGRVCHAQELGKITLEVGRRMGEKERRPISLRPYGSYRKG